MTGCASFRVSDPVLGAAYRPTNFHQADDRLPAPLRRVAVLPLTATTPASHRW
jgi:hypothetical protein